MGALPSQKYDTILIEYSRWLLKDKSRLKRLNTNSYVDGEVTLGCVEVAMEFLRIYVYFNKIQKLYGQEL